MNIYDFKGIKIIQHHNVGDGRKFKIMMNTYYSKKGMINRLKQAIAFLEGYKPNTNIPTNKNEVSKSE